MKLWGVAMARDEADIIEAFVRHNLSVLDGLSIIDHGSTDGTGEILASLAKEGLKLTVGHDPSVEFRQSATITPARPSGLRNDRFRLCFSARRR